MNTLNRNWLPIIFIFITFGYQNNGGELMHQERFISVDENIDLKVETHGEEDYLVNTFCGNKIDQSIRNLKLY